MLVLPQWHSRDTYICIVAKMAQLATMNIEDASVTPCESGYGFTSFLDVHLYLQRKDSRHQCVFE
jgi:thymidylate synthase